MITALNSLILAITSLLVLSVLPHFGIFFVVPLLPLFFIIPLTYFRKGAEPILLAAATGFILDIFSGYPFGFFVCFFLLVSLIVRLLFDEGLWQFSFWHYLLILTISILAFYGAQIIYFLLVDTPLSLNLLKSIFFGLLTNTIYGILFYAFSSWYFDRTIDIGNYIKRR